MLIWISGPTGSGKTSVCKLFQTCGYSVVAEELPEAEFNAFKSDPARHCAELQEEIMRSRFKGWKRLKDSRRIVFDRSIDEDIDVFCQMHLERGLLSKNEFIRLAEIANNLQANIPGPDLIVFLRPSEAALSARVTANSHPEVIVQTLHRQMSLYSEWLEGKTGEVFVLDNSKCALTGDSGEADRHSELIAITVPGWIRSVVGAKRRWRMDFPESDRDRQACCC